MDINYIKQLVLSILNREFKVSQKRRINEYETRLNFACPCCHDSSTNVNAKRGNLYIKNLMFICFNCGKKISLDKLCKEFDEQIDPDKKLEMINHIDSNISYSDYDKDVYDINLENLIDIDLLETSLNSGDLLITDFSPIVKNSIIYKYLIGRGISDGLHKNIYQAKYWYSDSRYENVICILNRKNNKVLGMQLRNLKDGKKRMFKIYNYEALYKLVYGVDEVNMDINQVLIFNKLSYYYNIMNVNFDDTVTIFEGYLDSLFFPNSIGVVGTNTDMKFIESKDLDIQYLYDNDLAGFKKSSEKIKNGYKVFLWKKLFEFITSNKKTNDPYSLLYRISKIKDLNQLASVVKNPYTSLNLDDFFSNDVFDIKFIPKNIFKKI